MAGRNDSKLQRGESRRAADELNGLEHRVNTIEQLYKAAPGRITLNQTGLQQASNVPSQYSSFKQINKYVTRISGPDQIHKAGVSL